jgi:mono/diheme cytochrome c family protein
MTSLRLTVSLLALTLLSSAAQAQSEDPIKHGRQLVTQFCSSCHAVGPYFRSRNPGAPPFRTLGRTFDLDSFPAMLERGISAAHPDMPVFKFSHDDARDVRAYLRTIQQ